MNDLAKNDITCEEWREYDIPGRKEAYRIYSPVTLYTRQGGTTHRVIDSEGIAHCVPVPGMHGCVLRWKNKADKAEVMF